ncbi:MAG: hypothetical protein M1305_06125 [Candidatus Marsarchaeota archaeon]|nr:hypothetical protein [Candidatus Marsarchaeota archaeon]
MASATKAVIDKWIDMPGPKRRLNKNGRFFFTEEGWAKYGRETIKQCQRDNVCYRVIAREEHDRNYDVIYQDRWQVVLRPCKKNHARQE